MHNIFLLHENVINGFQSINLDIITIAAIICGIFVIVSKNPIVSVLYLIGLFLSIAVYLMLQGLNFIALSYLLVYVGAVSILFLFILMLINVRISEIVSATSNSIPLAISIGTILYTIISKAFPHTHNLNYASTDFKIFSQRTGEYFKNLIFNIIDVLKVNPFSQDISCYIVLSNTWDGALANFSHINVIGNVIYTSFCLWLILTSLVLLLAMVGTIIITIKI